MSSILDVFKRLFRREGVSVNVREDNSPRLTSLKTKEDQTKLRSRTKLTRRKTDNEFVDYLKALISDFSTPLSRRGIRNVRIVSQFEKDLEQIRIVSQFERNLEKQFRERRIQTTKHR